MVTRSAVNYFSSWCEWGTISHQISGLWAQRGSHWCSLLMGFQTYCVSGTWRGYVFYPQLEAGGLKMQPFKWEVAWCLLFQAHPIPLLLDPSGAPVKRWLTTKVWSLTSQQRASTSCKAHGEDTWCLVTLYTWACFSWSLATFQSMGLWADNQFCLKPLCRQWGLLSRKSKLTYTVNICGVNTRQLCIHIFLFLHIFTMWILYICVPFWWKLRKYSSV